MAKTNGEAALRAKVKTAIERDGIGAVAAKAQLQPPTIWRFVSGIGRTHKGTLRLIEEAFK
jgi:hypothetical protein